MTTPQEPADAVRAALEQFLSYGCPACHGDCAAANPPVTFCPVQDGRQALAALDAAQVAKEWSCPKCGAQADERFDCCEVYAEQEAAPAAPLGGGEPERFLDRLQSGVEREGLSLTLGWAGHSALTPPADALRQAFLEVITEALRPECADEWRQVENTADALLERCTAPTSTAGEEDGARGGWQTDEFVLALAREVAISHNGPSYWDRMTDKGRDYWRTRVGLNIDSAQRNIAEGRAPEPVPATAADYEEAAARAAACATWHELKAQDYRAASKREHAQSHEEWCVAIRHLLTSYPPRRSISPEEIAEVLHENLMVDFGPGFGTDDDGRFQFGITGIDEAAKKLAALFPASGAPTLIQNQGAVSREEIAKRVERVVREHFYPGPIAGSTTRLTDALITEFALLSPPVEDQGQDSSRAVYGPDVERYAELGRACEQNGLAEFSPAGEMLFQPPADVIAEHARDKAEGEFAEIKRRLGEALAPFAEWERLESLHGSTIGHLDLADDVTAIVHTGSLQVRIGTVGDLRRAASVLAQARGSGR